jgi:hypothetical protein
MRPAVQDYDLWHLPVTERYARNEYTMEVLLSARGLALGAFDRIITDERAGVRWIPSSTAFIHSEIMREIESLKDAVGYVDSQSEKVMRLDTAEAIRGFWEEYIEARWTFDPATRLEDSSSWARPAMDAIDALLSQASDGGGGQAERYFPTESRQGIRRLRKSR